VVLTILGLGSLGTGPWRCDQLDQLDPAALDPGAGSAPSPVPPAPPSRPPPSPVPPAPIPTPPPATTPPIATAPRREEPTGRETLTPKKPPSSPRAVVPDEVVMSAVRPLQPTFLACWKRAQRNDPSLVSARVRLSLELDASGAVTSSRTDASDPKLSSCLANVARKLAFPSLGRPAAVEIPLFF
jgi:hypothetical protein